LGSQLVPPSFYETASGSSIFGSQASEKDLTVATAEEAAGATAAEGATREGKENVTRTKWKTLRFFVDERAIEEAIERMDDDRNVLEVR
jgi:autophagy-related protein 17